MARGKRHGGAGDPVPTSGIDRENLAARLNSQAIRKKISAKLSAADGRKPDQADSNHKINAETRDSGIECVFEHLRRHGLPDWVEFNDLAEIDQSIGGKTSTAKSLSKLLSQVSLRTKLMAPGTLTLRALISGLGGGSQSGKDGDMQHLIVKLPISGAEPKWCTISTYDAGEEAFSVMPSRGESRKIPKETLVDMLSQATEPAVVMHRWAHQQPDVKCLWDPMAPLYARSPSSLGINLEIVTQQEHDARGLAQLNRHAAEALAKLNSEATPLSGYNFISESNDGRVQIFGIDQSNATRTNRPELIAYDSVSESVVGVSKNLHIATGAKSGPQKTLIQLELLQARLENRLDYPQDNTAITIEDFERRVEAWKQSVDRAVDRGVSSLPGLNLLYRAALPETYELLSDSYRDAVGRLSVQWQQESDSGQMSVKQKGQTGPEM